MNRSGADRGTSARAGSASEPIVRGSAAVEERIRGALSRADRHGALRELMEAYEVPIFRYCRRMLTDDFLAEDVLQTTFLQAYEGLARFQGRSTFRTWLFGIARHRCLDALKARRRWWKTFELRDPQAEPWAADATAAEGPLEDYELSRSLEACLEKLNEKVRDAVLLRHVEGFSYPEMERICGDKAATLQMRVARALPALRRCLDSRGAAP